ncbi:BQ2448_2802 [Microbotryum intermedium]|uniref:BQ2448_2802 protein n=1 Tax=Microbotryum intermedium TaxID=269621 RepID=A0A238FH41_9BASI|nr:BQ2448_2802 [Microbotryum intermedium]
MDPASRMTTTTMAVDHSTVAAHPSHVNEHDQVHDVRHALRKLALSTWQDHEQDVIDSHRWLEGFLESVQLAHTQAAHQGIKPAMSELMKTPGRKRTANHGSALQQNNHPLGSAARHSTKDPVATLLFPNAAPPRFLHQGGKENSVHLSPAPRSPLGSPRGSPGHSAAPPSRIAQAKSPLRTASPRPALLKSTQAIKTLSAISAMSPPTSASKIPMDLAMDIDSPARPSKASAASRSKSAPKAAEPVTATLTSSKSYAMQDDDDVVFDAIAAAAAMEQDGGPLNSETNHDDQEDATAALEAAANAELSMIGEEEEEVEEDHRSIAEYHRTAISQLPGSIVSTAASSQASAPRLSAGASQGSQRVVSSSASSIAEEADADTAVPLNDGPSSLRNATATPLASSVTSSLPLSAQTTQTPGGSVASNFSYSVGSYSAAKVGSLGLGNSPPASNAARKSIGNNGPAKQLKFVSIPKKSLGLGLVRNWATSSTTTDSQQSSSSQVSSIGQVLSSTATTTTATGATKRKSMNDDGTAPPSKRTDPESVTSPPAASGVSTLMNRMREMQSRQSTVSGLSSRLSGINGSSSFAHKPLSSNLSLSVAAMSTTNGAVQSATTAPPSTTTSVAPTHAPAPAPVPAAAAPAPRPSVMDRVKSFERTASPTSTSTASRLPLSPSRLGRAMSPVTRSTTAAANTISPPQSPRMGIGSSTFGQSMSTIASPPSAAATVVRSPRIAAATSKIVSPAPSSPVKTTTTTTRSSPVVQPKSPARVADMAMHKMRISTTPKDSPPTKTSTTTSTKMTNLSALMKDMDEVASSRLNSPVGGGGGLNKSGLGKTTQMRYEDEEDEEEMVRDDEDDDGLLGQLPPRLEHDDADDESDGDRYSGGRTAVSKGQGKLAVAMDAEGGALKKSQSKMVMPGTFGAEDEEDEEGDRSMGYAEPTKFKPMHNTSTSSIRQPTLQKKSSHSSLASSQSSQAPSRPGSAMYGSVKGNTSVSSHIKSVQAAERARQKQQEEADRKNAQKLEVQNKRAEMAQKKKAEEDRMRKDELERRRKEREERERKLKQQRPETKKPTTQPQQQQQSQFPGSSAPLRPYAPSTSSNLNSSQPRPNGGLGASQPSQSSNHRQMPGASSSISATASSSMVGVKYMVPNPSNLGASSSAPRTIAPPQFATKAFAPPQPPRVAAPPAQPEPYQELPEIDSEYSDSGDEEARAVKIAAMPGWAQSPALAAALYAQQQVNPRDIFGPIPPLQMHEIFRNANLTRLTRRTSSACWEGTDALTADDLRRYEARMGYTRQSVSAQAARQ